MKIDINNLRTIKEIADSYHGKNGKGVSKTYISTYLKEYLIDIRGFMFVDITKLPKEIRDKIDAGI